MKQKAGEEGTEKFAGTFSFRPRENFGNRIVALANRRNRDKAKQIIHLAKIGLWLCDMAGTDEVDEIARKLNLKPFVDPDDAPVTVVAEQAALYGSSIHNYGPDEKRRKP